MNNNSAELRPNLVQRILSWQLGSWLKIALYAFLACVVIFVGGLATPGLPVVVESIVGFALFVSFWIMTAALGTAFLMAHWIVFTAQTHVERATARKVLLYGYVVLVIGAFFWAIRTPEGSDTYQFAYYAALIAVLLVIGWGVLRAFGLIDPLVLPRRATPEQLDHYESLPGVDEYMERHGEQRGIACYKCQSRNIHQFGLASKNDDRRIFKCMTCNIWLYKGWGANY